MVNIIIILSTNLGHLNSTNNSYLKDDLQMTNRTYRSGHKPHGEGVRETDAVTERAVKTRYTNLMDIIARKSELSTENNPLSLSLPVTPRSIEGYPIQLDEKENMNEKTARQLELIENRINSDFLKGYSI